MYILDKLSPANQKILWKTRTKDHNSMNEPIVNIFMHAIKYTLLDKGMPSTFPNLEAEEAPLLEV